MKIQVGDTVKVLYGKDAGKSAKVVRVFAKRNEVVLEGLNTFVKHVKGDGQSMKSQIASITKPVSAAKVQFMSEDGVATRVKYSFVDGKKVRVAVKGGKSIDIEKKSAKKADKKIEVKDAEVVEKTEKKAKSK